MIILMARIALHGEEGIKACDFELHLPKPSYRSKIEVEFFAQIKGEYSHNRYLYFLVLSAIFYSYIRRLIFQALEYKFQALE